MVTIVACVAADWCDYYSARESIIEGKPRPSGGGVTGHRPEPGTCFDCRGAIRDRAWRLRQHARWLITVMWWANGIAVCCCRNSRVTSYIARPAINVVNLLLSSQRPYRSPATSNVRYFRRCKSTRCHAADQPPQLASASFISDCASRTGSLFEAMTGNAARGRRSHVTGGPQKSICGQVRVSPG